MECYFYVKFTLRYAQIYYLCPMKDIRKMTKTVNCFLCRTDIILSKTLNYYDIYLFSFGKHSAA